MTVIKNLRGLHVNVFNNIEQLVKQDKDVRNARVQKIIEDWFTNPIYSLDERIQMYWMFYGTLPKKIECFDNHFTCLSFAYPDFISAQFNDAEYFIDPGVIVENALEHITELEPSIYLKSPGLTGVVNSYKKINGVRTDLTEDIVRAAGFTPLTSEQFSDYIWNLTLSNGITVFELV